MKRLLLLLALCLVAMAGDSGFCGGPFVVNVTSKSATIVWLVSGDDVIVQPPNGAAVLRSPAYRVEKTTLTGLKPNTRYEYNVPGLAGGKTSFKTAPAAPTATLAAVPFDFVAYGDNRTRPEVHQRVVNAILAHGTPDMILQSGDLVADGDDSALWATFFHIEVNLLGQAAFFPALGNHEHNSRQFYDILQKEKPYYSFDWGNAHFAVIDSDIGNVSKVESVRAAFWEEQTHWLEDDLKAHQTADFRFVAAHHPPYTAVASRQGDNPHMTALTPMLEQYHVAAGFFGHDHNYQHYLQNGIHYIVSGGGGAPLYDVDVPPPGITVKVASIENFVSVHVDGAVAHVQTITIDGKVLDEFELHGSAQPKPPAPAKTPKPAAVSGKPAKPAPSDE